MPGFYGNSGGQTASTCSGHCPSGHYCGPNAGTVVPTPCPRGTFYSGTTAPSVDACALCSPGQFSDQLGNNVGCQACPAGRFSDVAGGKLCSACRAGGYCPDPGGASSLVWEGCPAGSWSDLIGANTSKACTLCPVGTASPFRGQSSAATCQPCRAGSGTVALAAGLSSCEPCKGILPYTSTFFIRAPSLYTHLLSQVCYSRVCHEHPMSIP